MQDFTFRAAQPVRLQCDAIYALDSLSGPDRERSVRITVAGATRGGRVFERALDLARRLVEAKIVGDYGNGDVMVSVGGQAQDEHWSFRASPAELEEVLVPMEGWTYREVYPGDPDFGGHYAVSASSGQEMTGLISEADARLISAAPEMREALKHVYLSWSGWSQSDDSRRVLSMVHTVLAKVNGGE